MTKRDLLKLFSAGAFSTLAFACASEGGLDQSFSEFEQDSDTLIVDQSILSSGECGAETVVIADDDGTKFCVPKDFCSMRVGDFCSGAPKAFARTDGNVMITGDALFFCRAAGTLVQDGDRAAGVAYIEAVDGRRYEHGASQITHDPARGCLVNNTGHGMRDTTCDAFDGGDHPQTVTTHVDGMEYICADNGAVTDIRFGGADDMGYEVVSRTPSDLPIEPSDPVSGACTTPGTVLVDLLTQDGSTSTICVDEGFCDGRRPNQTAAFCADAPDGVTNSTGWAQATTQWNDYAGVLFSDTAMMIHCNGDLEEKMVECPGIGSIDGQCIANDAFMGCRDLSGEVAAQQEYDQLSTSESYQDWLRTSAREVSGRYCSQYKSEIGEGEDFTLRLREFRVNEAITTDGTPIQKVDASGVDDDTCNNECVPTSFGTDDRCL